MRTQKKRTQSRMTRGVRIGSKSRRRSRKSAGRIQPKDEVTQKLETLTTL